MFPRFVGNDRLRVFRIHNGRLSLVELDLTANDPINTAVSVSLIEAEATRVTAWKIATTYLSAHWHSSHSFYHPRYKRMAIWEPDATQELRYLAPQSVAAAPVGGGSLLQTNEFYGNSLARRMESI